ncbi:DUF1795 domain-containing protein [Paraburkholderia tropica]|uniref:DcrB-related protein n=1 Tax=Paraburkholderia tropica TaxID=92647 RepID=UPI0016015A31|nr:DUF1795 domain-containing protein [Paraburkholderia tropica]QNB14649.1 DUF1795 domain-containing protein [Paraburkholderia tropica]
MTTRYSFEEGSIALPVGYTDRSINIFVQEPMTDALANLQVTRDTVQEGESLDDYAARQIRVLKRRIKGLAVTSQETVTLTGGRTQAVEIETRYQSNGKSVYQRQCAVLVANGRVLVFTATNTVPFTTGQLAAWRQWTESFAPA